MELIILVGLQASGKSSWYRQRFADTHLLVSKDLISEKQRKAVRQLRLIEEALQAGRSVVVDNTNPTVEDRAALIALGKQYGAEIIGYYFEPDLRGSLARNREREGRERVPVVGLYVAAKKLTRPTFNEGFARLYTIRIAEGGKFAVQPFSEEDREGMKSPVEEDSVKKTESRDDRSYHEDEADMK